MPRHPSSTVTLKNFKGLDNKNPPERLGEGFLEQIDNFDIDASGSIRKRLGYSQIVSGTDVHSIFADGDDRIIYVDNGDIKVYNIDTTSGVLSTNNPTSRIDYYKINNKIYFSGLEYNGVIEDNIVRPWGITSPHLPILTQSTAGLLTEGRYQVTTTFVSSDGRESGAMLASVIYVTSDNSSIQCTNLPTSSTDSTVTHLRIYCSTPNGETMYLVASFPLGSSTYTITDLSKATKPLATQFIMPAPKGELVSMYNGRMYLADENILWYSEPHAYEWFNVRSDFIVFDSPITNIMPVDDGIFIASDKLYFLEGNGPETFRLREREIYKGIKRTAVKIIGSHVQLENIPTGLKWLFSSDKGIIMVGTGGMVFNLTEKTVMLDKATEGAAIFKSSRGINQYISLLKNPENNRLRVGDSVTAEVIRNGITIS